MGRPEGLEPPLVQPCERTRERERQRGARGAPAVPLWLFGYFQPRGQASIKHGGSEKLGKILKLTQTPLRSPAPAIIWL